PRRQDFADFLDRKNIHALNAQQIERRIVRTPLPLEGEGPGINAVRTYWTSQYEDYEGVGRSFAMVDRLALRVLQEDSDIRRGLHLSDPVIFVDEFQDTTAAEYEVLGAAFDEAQPVFTAVGDDKQRI